MQTNIRRNLMDPTREAIEKWICVPARNAYSIISLDMNVQLDGKILPFLLPVKNMGLSSSFMTCDNVFWQTLLCPTQCSLLQCCWWHSSIMTACETAKQCWWAAWILWEGPVVGLLSVDLPKTQHKVAPHTIKARTTCRAMNFTLLINTFVS